MCLLNVRVCLSLCMGVNVVKMKMVRIFSDRIRDRIRLEGFKSVRIQVQIFSIRYRIRIRIIKSHIYDIDIQSYPIRYPAWLTLSVFEFESGQKYKNKCNIGDIRPYPIHFHPYPRGLTHGCSQAAATGGCGRPLSTRHRSRHATPRSTFETPR